ncbi:MAG TPA: ornithine cyclodeaminase family protein [Sphingopyxis sp.]|uniref:ornithine cyclodeaminase family protein n=1 Tax=Sphingopyxis sp. TaxID=1908224 RepID=UPI002CA4EFEF|nr:ornithine cyclodeaminase family protein [Sphingopyxis sp.]HWW57792.1 ornithine cyclodeaminase family protein [Sphingopyxis sp.]
MTEAAATVPWYDAAAVARATPMPALIAALRKAFASGAFYAPARLAADMDGASLLVMPAWKRGERIGTKIVTVDPRARPSIRSTYVLTDRVSGRPIALIDGAALTRRRTAAASVLAASRLARPESATLFVIGTGALNAPIIEAYASAFGLTRVLVWGRDAAKAEEAARAARDRGYPAAAIATVAAGLAEADIVSAATLATEPLIAGALLRPGMHVDLIGAFRPDMREADVEAFARARVFVDTREGALEEAGDLLRAIATGAICTNAIEADLAALCSGAHPGRSDDRDAITLFKSVGTAIEDLAAAELVAAGVAP